MSLSHKTQHRQKAQYEDYDDEHLMGDGSANLTKSLVETYRRLDEKDLLEEDSEQVRRFGEQIRAQPLQLLEGVQETLAHLSPRHDLFLLTKGDSEEQKLKVERSGVEDYFKQVVTVPEKDVTTYHRIVSELQIDPQRTWMVGNSPRSDINPALAAGLNAVYIPHPHTWHLEHEEVQYVEEGRLLTLSTFADLCTSF